MSPLLFIYPKEDPMIEIKLTKAQRFNVAGIKLNKDKMSEKISHEYFKTHQRLLQSFKLQGIIEINAIEDKATKDAKGAKPSTKPAEVPAEKVTPAPTEKPEEVTVAADTDSKPEVKEGESDKAPSDESKPAVAPAPKARRARNTAK